MPRRMTIVFDDEELYTALKVRAARTHSHAKDIVASALEMFFEATPEEHASISARVRRRGRARGGDATVERLLADLGIRR